MGAPRSQRTAVLAPSRERIREAAKTLFTERGYEGTSTAAICRLARTSHPNSSSISQASRAFWRPFLTTRGSK